MKLETVDISPDLPLPPDDDLLLPPCDDDDDVDDEDDDDYIADRAPVIEDDDDGEEGEMPEIDMDVVNVMSVEAERVSGQHYEGVGMKSMFGSIKVYFIYSLISSWKS